MPPRGRLIYAFTARLAQLSPAETAKDPDGAGPLTSGYDDVFREPVVIKPYDGERQVVRSETIECAPCQVEFGSYEQLQMMAAGDSPTSRLVLVFHFRDLERLSLVDATTGAAKIQKTDRLAAIYDRCNRKLVQSFPDPPGLFVEQVMSSGFGIGRRRNLLIVTLAERQQTARATVG